jgi:hypothetical protein
MLVSLSVGVFFIYPVVENLFCQESGEMKITFFTHKQTANIIGLHMGQESTTKIYVADEMAFC